MVSMLVSLLRPRENPSSDGWLCSESRDGITEEGRIGSEKVKSSLPESISMEY